MRIKFADLYAISLVTVVVLGVVFPSIVFFRIAYDSQIKYYYRNVLLHFEYSLEERNKRIATQYSEVNDVTGSSLVPVRMDARNDQYQEVFYRTRVENYKEPFKPDTAYAFFDTLLIPTFMPPYNRLTIQSKILSSTPSDLSYQWGRTGSTLVMRMVHPITGFTHSGQSPMVDLTSDTKAFSRIIFERSRFQWVVIFIVAAVLFILLYYLLRFVAAEMFLLNIDPLKRLRERKAAAKNGIDFRERVLDEQCHMCSLFEYSKKFNDISKGIQKRNDFHTLTENELLELVYEQALSYYKALWQQCSTEERFVLWRLSEDRFISSDNGRTIVNLLDRGLLVRSPDLRLVNETFARFVAETADPVEIVSQEKTKHVKGWGMLRSSFLVVLILLVFFLFGTQREVYNSTITFISAAAAMLPALFRLFGVFDGAKGSGMPDK